MSSQGPTARALAALIVGILVLTATGCASMAPRLEPGHVGFLAASAGDVVSTRRALDAGAVEQNPLLGESPATTKLVGMKVGGWFVLRGLETALEKQLGRELRWWERVLYWAVPTGLATWATKHNLGVAERYQAGQ